MAGPSRALADALIQEGPPRSVLWSGKTFTSVSLLIAAVLASAFVALVVLVPFISSQSEHLRVSMPSATMAGVALQPAGVQRLVQPARAEHFAKPAGLPRFEPSGFMKPSMPRRVAPAKVSIQDFNDATNHALVLNPGEWGDADFERDVEQRFNAGEGIANALEARVLLEKGYKWLDVRTDQEWDEGHVPDGIAFHVQILEGSRRFDSEAGTRVFKEQKPNPNFVKQVEDMFPNKDEKLLVACSDSRKRAMMALELLDGAGYKKIVGLKGGYLTWQKYYDARFRRRRADGFVEDYSSGGTAGGIHGTGAGHEWTTGGMTTEYVPTKDPEKWIDYKL